MKLYMLWGGYYVDFNLIGIFDTLEKAQAIGETDLLKQFGENHDTEWEHSGNVWRLGDTFGGYEVTVVELNKPIGVEVTNDEP